MESILLVIARASLALVLGVAGAAKLVDRSGSRQAMLDFGVPAALASPLGLILPLSELALALALLPADSARAAAAGAFVLLLLFIAGITWNLVRGRRPDCHCFGLLRSRPIGTRTLAQNGVLLGLAGWVAARPAPAWSAAAEPSLAALTSVHVAGLAALAVVGIVMAAQGWLLSNLLRQNGRLLLRVDALEARLGVEPSAPAEALAAPSPTGATRGLPVGTPAPAFELPALDGPAVSLDRLRALGRPVLLVSVDPGCEPCRALLPDVAQWQRTRGETLTVAVLTRGSAEANRSQLAPLGITAVLIQADDEVATRYGATGTPSAVLVDAAGRIAAPVASGSGEVRRLAQRALRPEPAPRSDSPRGLPVGTLAPAVRLTALDGSLFDLAERLGEPTLLLFWNPGCGYCRRMLDDLRMWEADRASEDGALVLVAAGGVEANAGQGLRSPILLDTAFATGQAFGASGTPSAVLLGPDGTVASALVVGATAVMELLRGTGASAGRITAPASPPSRS